MNYDSIYILQTLFLLLFIGSVKCFIEEYKLKTVSIFVKTRRLSLNISGYKYDTLLGKEEINAYDRYEMWRYIEKRR